MSYLTVDADDRSPGVFQACPPPPACFPREEEPICQKPCPPPPCPPPPCDPCQQTILLRPPPVTRSTRSYHSTHVSFD